MSFCLAPGQLRVTLQGFPRAVRPHGPEATARRWTYEDQRRDLKKDGTDCLLRASLLLSWAMPGPGQLMLLVVWTESVYVAESEGQMFATIAWPGRVEKAGVPCSSQSFSQKGELLETRPSSLPDFSSGWK